MDLLIYVCLNPGSALRAYIGSECSVQSFLMAFPRFTSRRGLPAMLISDNAKTFRAASKEIRELPRSKRVLNHLVNNRVTWSFIVEKAPCWGGVLGETD